MKFRKMVTITLYARQQKKHRYKEQTFGLWEKVRVGWFERIALKHVYYQMWNRWPVQVWCMKQGTQSRCTGTSRGMGWGGRDWYSISNFFWAPTLKKKLRINSPPPALYTIPKSFFQKILHIYGFIFHFSFIYLFFNLF